MTASSSFRTAHRLALATAALMFGLIVLGSIVRTTGSGLACPDWPLCEGRLIPRMQFNVLIEWGHRLVALIVGLGLLGTLVLTMLRPELRARLGALAGLALLLYVVQALLGALTVWKLLDPGIVGGHLAVALLLFCTLLTYTSVAGQEADGGPSPESPTRPAGLLPTLIVATGLTYAQCVLGGIVSTHHAGLACPDWPGCNGELFPRLEGLVGLQMLHRYGAYLLTGFILFSSVRTRVAPDAGIRAGAPILLSLTVAQVVLGVCNVFLGTPWWLSAIHLATAATMLAVALTLTFRAASLPAARATFTTVAAR